MSRTRLPPLLYDYLKKWQDDPTSRVFAPLAEAYRKVGMIDEAIEIAREGLRVHPSFVGGRVSLARALFEKKLYADVCAELQSIIHEVPDNVVAQRLFADSCMMLGRVAEALSGYKMLLYLTPTDAEIAKIVHELEFQAYEQGTLVLRTDQFKVSPSGGKSYGVIEEDPLLKRERWVKRIEYLQNMLLKVERYKTKLARP